MGVEITVRYDGRVACTATHGPSGQTLRSVAPTDNGGDGSSFSPTDLLATGLATCVVTIMAMAAAKRDIDLTGVTAHVEKIMSPDTPRRIARCPLTVTIPPAVAALVPAAIRPALEAAGRSCPVKVTLGEQVDAPITYVWAD